MFDAIADGDAAAAEIARLLPPGGRFWHFLDMATLLEAPFAKLHASNLVPIPNVLGDPAEHEWPLDILLLDRDWLAGLLDFSAGIDHPLAIAFAPSFAPFLKERFDADEAARAFKAIASSGDRRHALMSAFVSASRLAISSGYPARKPLPFHSGKYLKSVLDTAFGGDAFEIELSEIVTRSASRPATDRIRYRSLCLGHERVMASTRRACSARLSTCPRATCSSKRASSCSSHEGSADAANPRILKVGLAAMRMTKERLAEAYGGEYPAAVMLHGVRMKLSCERRFSRDYSAEDGKHVFVNLSVHGSIGVDYFP